jgi:anti-sigma-K factor RskA
MKCPIEDNKDEQILLDYCCGGLEESRAAEIETHARECAACSAWIAEQRAVWSALDDFTPPEVSPEFNALVYQKIEAQQGGWWKHLWRAAWKPALATAAVGAALLIGMIVNVHHPADAPTKASIDNVDIEQVEHALDDLNLLMPGDSGGRL